MNRRQFLKKSFFSVLWGTIGFHAHMASAACAATSLKPGTTPQLALIIDDIGFSRSRAERFFKIDALLTFAVLPRLDLSRDLALEIHERGQEVMLHQPMEPFNGHLDPGPGAVYVKDDSDKIAATIKQNLSDLPFIAGVNNHMGSKFTSSPEKMAQLLPQIKNKGLFFVDSLTTGRSKAFRTARRLHIPAASRNVFIDNHREESEILRRLNKLALLAQEHGRAIGIGHPYPETSRAVAHFVRTAGRKSFKFVHVSDILKTLPA
jgi:polysaccharide deacetylase 2 family uncharacterized protein YibQ